ncbi:hypothetical protein WNY37_09695 [Henriciella sp. AS95]|uniref:hypothetical protein n=1 Tax=Henriciella sp. AS95 TaxID=3135782 RepID=UPI00317FB49E
MTTEKDFDLEAMFQAEDEALPEQPFTQSVMSRISYASMRRRVVLGAGCLAGAAAALAILPAGLISATESVGRFKLPELSMQSLETFAQNPYSFAVLAIAGGCAALLAGWGLEKAG